MGIRNSRQATLARQPKTSNTLWKASALASGRPAKMREKRRSWTAGIHSCSPSATTIAIPDATNDRVRSVFSIQRFERGRSARHAAGFNRLGDAGRLAATSIEKALDDLVGTLQNRAAMPEVGPLVSEFPQTLRGLPSLAV